MTEAGAVLKFPGGKPSKKPETLKAPPLLPSMDLYEYEETVELHTIAVSVKRKGEEIIGLIDEDRESARKVGIEVLGVQIRTILEGEKFDRVFDALEDAVFRKVPVSLTREGIDKVHRLERLVSDADTIIIQRMAGRKGELGRSLKAAASGQSTVDFWVPLMIVGIAGIVGVIATIAITNNRQNNQPAPVPAQPVQPAKLAGRPRKSKKQTGLSR